MQTVGLRSGLLPASARKLKFTLRIVLLKFTAP